MMREIQTKSKRRAGVPAREKPKPVSPAFAAGAIAAGKRKLPAEAMDVNGTCTACDVGCAEPVEAACATRDAAGGNGRPKRISRTARARRHREKPATGEIAGLPDGQRPGAIEPPPVRVTAAVERSPAPEVIGTHLLVALIDPSPFQPRRDFPAEEIRALADSIAADGLLAPIAVRLKGRGRYELLDGERRLRAVRLLGLPAIRAEVQDRSDAEARAIVLLAALQRKDLNAIEQARAFRAMLDAGDAPTQMDLAKRLGLSQGQVSNTVRLLELPDPLQRRVISGELPIGQARAILPYAGHPRLTAAIEKRIGEALKRAQSGDPTALPPPGEFGGLIGDAAGEIGRRIRDTDSRQSDDKSRREYRPYRPSPEEAEGLEIVEIEVWPGEKQKFALNRKRFDALAAADRARQLAAGDGKPKRAEAKADKAKAAPPPRKLSPAEHQRQEAAERKRDAQRRASQARLTARSVHAWRVNRLREAVAAALRDPSSAEHRIEERRIAIWLLVAADGWTLHGSAALHRARDREELFRSVFRVAGGSRGEVWPRSVWPSIAALDAAAVVEGIPELLASLIWPPTKGPQVPIPDEVVIGMAGACRVDLAALWKTDQKGPAGKAYYELHTREQLVALGKELDCYLDPKLDKAAMVRLLGNPRKLLPLPKELGGKKPRSK